MNFFKNIVYFILSIQEKILMKKLDKTLGIKNESKNKNYFTRGCFLKLSSISNAEKQKMEDELSLILKSCNYEPTKILNHIKNKETGVYYIKNSKLLHSIGENEGFIYPAKGAKALYISLLTQKKFKFHTPGMFILTKGEINKYYFIYHFYNWYAHKKGIAGMDSNTQDLLKKYLYNNSDEEIKQIQLAYIYKLKDAIRQDKAAIEFVFKLCQQYDGSKKALEKLVEDGASI